MTFPDLWDEGTIRHNVLRKYSVDQVNGTDFDPGSIMLCAFPDSWTANMGATRENDKLSDLDRQIVQGAQMYPGRLAPQNSAVELPVCAATLAEISAACEEYLYRFEVSASADHVIRTSASTDAVLTLFGPDSPISKIAEDDDGGEGTNSLIRVALEPDIYYAGVRHYDASRTGHYRIQVSAL